MDAPDELVEAVARPSDRCERAFRCGDHRPLPAVATCSDCEHAVQDLALLVQILWARYPSFLPPAELGDFMDGLPDDLIYALMASTGQSYKAASWESDHPTCALIRSLDEQEAD